MNEEITNQDLLKDITDKEYEYGFVSDIDIEEFPKGLNEDIVRRISARKGEPDWLLEFRLKAYRYWTPLRSPTGDISTLRSPTIRISSIWPSQKRRNSSPPWTRWIPS